MWVYIKKKKKDLYILSFSLSLRYSLSNRCCTHLSASGNSRHWRLYLSPVTIQEDIIGFVWSTSNLILWHHAASSRLQATLKHQIVVEELPSPSITVVTSVQFIWHCTAFIFLTYDSKKSPLKLFRTSILSSYQPRRKCISTF